MVERYARKVMKDKWTQQAKYDAWLKVELAAVKAWNKLGFIPDDDCEKICKNAKFSVERIDEIEKTTKHDVIAFLTSVSESLGEESRFVHYGMTSSDCIDTAVALQIKDSLDLIIADIEALKS
ncbi:MAG: adenylosuccinate lyase, partial [Campylobacter sp.]|nr:adenylosuccinate lyase [Campylobacter sp.]